MPPPVSCQQMGWLLKKGLVMGHRFDRLPMLVGVLQNLVACHDTAIDFIQDHLPSKFDQRTAFVAGDVGRIPAHEAGARFPPYATPLPPPPPAPAPLSSHLPHPHT